MNKHFLILLCCLFCRSAFAERSTLKFNDGKFKIVQVTDLHWVEDESNKSKNDSTYNLIREAVREERPDIVIMTGDIVVSDNALSAWKKLANLFEEEKTPFAVTFGNHDTETDMTKAQILDYLLTVPYNRTYNAEDGKLSGYGNCALPVLSSDGKSEKWMLYLFDSHSYTSDRAFGHYAWIAFDQINWYRRMSDAASTRNKQKLPSLAFLHIPLPEYETARQVCREIGEKREDVCAPTLNSGLFTSFVENRDVIGVFCGHDHNNDYIIDIGGNIALAYGRKTGYRSAYNETLSRGYRTIILHEDEAVYDTYIRDLEGIYARYTFEQKNKGTSTPQFSGSFVQEHLVADWDDARWNQEMTMLKEAGMKYLIYAPAFLTDAKGKTTAYYPSSMVNKNQRGNTIEKCLRSAEKHGIKLFIGLNFHERWWKVDYDARWLLEQMETGNKVADELTALYKEKYPAAMHGWYWVWEADNKNCTTAECRAILAEALNTNLNHLSKITPDMPLMLSPFMDSRDASAEDCGSLWESIFAQTNFRTGDIFAPQDCVGAGGLTTDNVQKWFAQLKKAVNTKPGLKFWGNVETFDQRFWVSAPLSRVKTQMECLNGFVSNLICFAYSHYNSPFVVNEDYHRAYVHYCQEGKLPTLTVPQKVASATRKEAKKGVLLTWIPGDTSSVSGYSIYKDGTLLKRLQILYGAEKPPATFTDESGDMSNKYEISAYNAIGDESEKVKAD